MHLNIRNTAFIIIFYYLSFFLFLSLFVAGNVFAEVVATVNIRNAKIVSQTENTFNISFDLSNGEGIQAGVKYSVLLTKTAQNSFVDRKVYDEIITLGENQTIHKTISYISPVALSGGAYRLWLESRNASGLTLAVAFVSDVSMLAVIAQRVEILPETCYLTVRGETNAERYTLFEGVDIAENETLLVVCELNSNVPENINLAPVFETYLRTEFGDKVSQSGGTIVSIAVRPGKSSLSFELPKAAKPQAYDVKFFLKNNDKNIVSNAIVLHYVLRGASGTIQNVIFDKSSYRAGEVANLQIFQTPSADNFPDSRAGRGTIIGPRTIAVTIFDESGAVCGVAPGEPIEAGKDLLEVSIPITQDCGKMTAKATLVNIGEKDAVLDTREFKVTVPTQTSDITQNAPLINFISVPMLMLLLLALIAIAFIVIFYLRYVKKD